MPHYIDYDRVYRDSFSRVQGSEVNGKNFFERFYEWFLGSSHEAREKFKGTDFSVQIGMLRDSLGHIQRFSLYKREDDEMLSLAHRHSHADLDIQPRLYDVWLSSLIATVKEHDPEFDDEVELAWRIQLAAGVEYMKFKYLR